MSDKVGLNEHQYHPYPMGNGVNQEEETTLKSRSVQRRVARQKGLTAPDFSQDDKLREKIISILRENSGNIAYGYSHENIEDFLKAILSPTADQIHAAYKEAGYVKLVTYITLAGGK